MPPSDLPPPANPDSLITGKTVITGAEFRAFYLENWPGLNWCLEDCEYAIEGEESGEFILADNARLVLGYCGYLAWQGSDSVRRTGTSYPLVDFYRAFAERNTRELSVVSIGAEHQEALAAFVAEHGGTLRPATLSRQAVPSAPAEEAAPAPGPR